MNDERLAALRSTYRDGLLDDTLPFWTRHAVDREHGGFLFGLDRDGSVVDTDKGVWQNARFIWLLSTLYDQVAPRESWLELAAHGIEFLRAHAFDDDGRMFFLLTRTGEPLRKRRYVFTETFGAIGFAAYAKISGDARAVETARGLFDTVLRHFETPGLIEPKIDAQSRPMKSLAVPMISIVTAQILRETVGHPRAAECIERAIGEIRDHFVHPELEAVLENVGPQGQLIDHFDGRLLNPGHAIEAAWFVLAESRYRGGDAELVELGTRMLDWMWKIGWDEEYGGLFYFRDVSGKPVQEYWHDMKFWWPHNEAIIATLMAYRITGDGRYARWHTLVHDWAHAHFPDTEHGEWFGYLHRDGRLSTTLKGGTWKGPFHLPRMQLICWQLTEELMRASGIDLERPA